MANHQTRSRKCERHALCLRTSRFFSNPAAASSPTPAFCLTPCRNIKIARLPDLKRSDHRPRTDHWFLTDAGFNLTLSMATYNWYYHLISASRAGDEHDFPYKLAGPLCDGGDVYFDIEGNRPTCPTIDFCLKTSSLAKFWRCLNCGAYTLSQASQYNSRALPAVVLDTHKRRT